MTNSKLYLWRLKSSRKANKLETRLLCVSFLCTVIWRKDCAYWTAYVRKYILFLLVHRCTCMWIFACVLCTSGAACPWGNKHSLVIPDLLSHSLYGALTAPQLYSTFPHFAGPFGYFRAMQSASQLCYISLESDSLLVHPAPPVRVPLTCKDPHTLNTSVRPRNEQLCTLCLVQMRFSGQLIPAVFSGK